MAKYLLDDAPIIEDLEDAHRVLANGAAEGAACQTRRITSRHFFDGSLWGAAGERPGRWETSAGGSPLWRTPRILLLYQP